jgi:hypothetical protein
MCLMSRSLTCIVAILLMGSISGGEAFAQGGHDPRIADLAYFPLFDALVGTWTLVSPDTSRTGTLTCSYAAGDKALYMSLATFIHDDQLDTPESTKSNILWCANRDSLYAFRVTRTEVTPFHSPRTEGDSLSAVWRSSGQAGTRLVFYLRSDSLVTKTIQYQPAESWIESQQTYRRAR